MWDNVLTMAKGMNNRFPDGNSPYEIMTRLLEECLLFIMIFRMR